MEKLLPEEEKNLNDIKIPQNYSWKQNIKGVYKLTPFQRNLETINNRKISQCTNKTIKNEMKIIDNSEKFKNEMTVMTEWGIGKIVELQKDTQIAVVRIEDSDVEFPLITLNPSITINFCVMTKEQSYWIEIKAEFDYTINSIKKKLSQIIKCHPYQIVLVHGGRKITNNINIFDLGIYEKDVFLAVIKDPEELSITRGITHKLTNKNPLFNAIRFKTTHDIILSGLGLYKNNSQDVYYNIFIFEEELNGNLKLIYSNKKIAVKCEDTKENPIFKNKISQVEIKESNYYQIHVYLNETDNNQFIGIKCLNKVLENKTQIWFNFYNCKIQGRDNSSDLEEGMVPILYFYVKNFDK